MKNITTLIIGANSEIAKAIAQQIVNEEASHLIVISRDTSFYNQPMFANITTIEVDSYLEAEISEAIKSIDSVSTNKQITRVFICHGVLHNQTCQPEKRLEDFNANTFNEIVAANTITPMLWLKYLVLILGGKATCKIIFFTARVASITDNKLGGWYSYRASKAALNMLLKSATVELNRRAKNIKLVSFHPGTTDSPLSKPFQRNVPEGKLFTSEFVASQLINFTEKMSINGELSYIDWQGKPIPW
ncbi:SDR family NAD(P)-dependent oxidoreductase [Thalassotalea sp. M1531]|uniref:SDR family NAD(P)-dependent oxidoreductase n=1 Tax=Thalassotalea algicola TaxID=2716224 RepID=A0A7Y0L9S3_9GAMM|nr:SDR family NAD(P)-dependent oxidoreductase [Thalassotalea algicola]NMP30397.1 SDR family NAD(P)-dependent oxidoreductase [Thalassotalea algicola]